MGSGNYTQRQSLDHPFVYLHWHIYFWGGFADSGRHVVGQEKAGRFGHIACSGLTCIGTLGFAMAICISICPSGA